MYKDTPSSAYHQTPDEAFWIESSEPSLDSTPEVKPSGRFRKGFDPRRHQLTAEERSRGFWNAIESIVTRHPDAIMRDGRHMACNFLRSRKEAA